MTAPFVQERFEADVQTWHQKMTAAILLRRGIAYNGRIGDVDVIVFGWVDDPSDPTALVKPLAVVMTPELFELLEVDALKDMA